jgi:hypothetical protein
MGCTIMASAGNGMMQIITLKYENRAGETIRPDVTMFAAADSVFCPSFGQTRIEKYKYIDWRLSTDANWRGHTDSTEIVPVGGLTFILRFEPDNGGSNTEHIAITKRYLWDDNGVLNAISTSRVVHVNVGEMFADLHADIDGYAYKGYRLDSGMMYAGAEPSFTAVANENYMVNYIYSRIVADPPVAPGMPEPPTVTPESPAIPPALWVPGSPVIPPAFVTPELPNGMPGSPALPSAPGMSVGMPGLPALPSAPGMPVGLPAISSAPVMIGSPVISRIPVTAGSAVMPALPVMSEQPTVTQVTVTEPAPENAGMSSQSKASSLRADDARIPLGTAAAKDHWALLNLIMAVAGIVYVLLISIAAVLRRRDRPKYVDGQAERRLHPIWYAVGLVCAIFGAVLFFLTEDLTAQMILADKWTIIMVIVLAADVIAATRADKNITYAEAQKDTL